MERFRTCFADLDDPRTGNAQRHDLLEVLLIALAATLCGAETSVDVALFGRAKEPFLRRFLRLEGGVPSHDTFSRIFRRLEAIVERGGDYCLALKGNQPALFKDVTLLLDDPYAPPGEVATTTDGDHGRIETRRAEIVRDAAWLAETHGFPGLQAIGKVTATREVDGKSTTATRTYVLSKPLSAARFAEVVRAHWQIENALHWVLDVVMEEDQARARKDHAPENLARLRRFALNLLRANPDKGSTRLKFKRAGWDDTFLLKILTTAECDRRAGTLAKR